MSMAVDIWDDKNNLLVIPTAIRSDAGTVAAEKAGMPKGTLI